jgi:MFS family permease
MLGKKFGPAVVLPILMACFGSMTILTVAATNFGGMMALRWFLGMSESAFFPLVIYYLTTFYRRGELARRLAIFYAASNIANAFSGLLAVGVFRITNTPLYPWRYLFLIEGSLTLLFAIFAFFYLPGSAATARFLNESEKKLAYHRIQVDSSSIVNEKFNLRDSLKIFKQPTTYAFLAIEICLGVPLQSVSLFLPQIVGRLGYSTIKTNLYTVAPNISGAVMLLILAFSSDYARRRGPFIVLGFLFTFVGFIIYATIDGTFLGALFSYRFASSESRVCFKEPVFRHKRCLGTQRICVALMLQVFRVIANSGVSYSPPPKTRSLLRNLLDVLGYLRAFRPPQHLVQ